jgi:anti-sigma regulatory factor (Ser/Thr protein kinase)
MADPWPLQSFLELAPLASAVPRARRHVRQLLREWNLTESFESAELVVSELLTNAVQATGVPEVFAPVRLWLLSDKRRVLILVWDSIPQPPTRMEAGDDAENGWDCYWWKPSARGGTGTSRVTWAGKSYGHR